MSYNTQHRAFIEYAPDEDTATTVLYHLISHTPGAGFVWRQLAVEHYTVQLQDMNTEPATDHRATKRRTRSTPRVDYYGSVPIVHLVGEEGVSAQEAATFFRGEVQGMVAADDVFEVEVGVLPGTQLWQGWPPLGFIAFLERFRTDQPQEGEEIGKEDYTAQPFAERFPRGLFGMDYEA